MESVMSRFSLVATITILCGRVAAGAQEIGDCGHPVPERSLQGCSALIEASRAAPEALSTWYTLRGAAYVIRGEYDRAIVDLNKAIRLNPKNPEAFTTRGDAYAKKAGIARVVRDLEKLRVGARYFGRSSQKRMYTLAIADYDNALRLDGDFKAAHHGRELARLGSGEKNRVEGDLLLGGLAQQLHRSQSPFLMRQSALLLQSEIYTRKATERFAPLDEAIRENPNDPQLFLDRAWAFVNFGKPDFAIADYTQAITIDPNHVRAYVQRAEVFLDRGEYDRATADCNEAVRLKPEEFRGYDLRGLLFEKTGERDKAIADYRRALSLEPRAGYATDGLRRLGAVR
jgi:tetratricopeptide (TPR) repeat protein